MATIETPRTAAALGLRRITEFDEAYAEERLRGRRLALMREGALAFRRRFAAGEQVRAVRTLDLASTPYPTRFAFHGTARAPLTPMIMMVNRLLVVQFRDFGGALRTFCWEPTDPDGSAQAPFYAQLDATNDRYPDAVARWRRGLFNAEYRTTEAALAECGLRPADVDLASFDHLHVQDPRLVAPHLPNATFLAQQEELDTFASMHPMTWYWYVEGGMDGVDLSRWAALDGDYELGHGIAIVRTPGHTDGNHSLVLNTPSGVWVSSENGVAVDNWQPELSKIPGVAKAAAAQRREVIFNANTLEDSVDQYDSMVKEKTIAGPSARGGGWLNILPSTELAPLRRQWPVVPTFHQGGLQHGEFVRPA